MSQKPDKKLEAILSLGLDDNASKGMKGINKELDAFNDKVKRNDMALASARSALAMSLAAGAGLAAMFNEPINRAREFQTLLEDIGQKADLSLPQMNAEGWGDDIRGIARNTATLVSDVAGSIDQLTSLGLDLETSMGAAQPIGMTATAYRAPIDEVTEAVGALIQNMGIAAGDTENVLDIMAKGGKLGSFELKDMAGEFASLTPLAKSLGMEGSAGVAQLVAALEVARLGASSGSEAANNARNFMSKLSSAETITRFKKMGIDIEAEFAKAAENGQTSFEHMLELIARKTEGDPFKLSEMFGDQQVLAFLRPLMANMDMYRETRDQLADAGGTVQADFDARLEGPWGAQQDFLSALDNFTIAMGNSVLPKLTELLKAVTPIIDDMTEFVDKNGELVGTAVELTAEFIALTAVVSAARIGMALMYGAQLKRQAGLLGDIAGVGGTGKTGGKAGTVGGKTGAGAFGPLSYLGIMGGFSVASDMTDFQNAVKEDGGQSWLEARDQRDAEINDWLRSLRIGDFAPFVAYDDLVTQLHGDGTDAQGPDLAPPDDGPNSLAALNDIIASLEAEAEKGKEIGNEIADGVGEGLTEQSPAARDALDLIINDLKAQALTGNVQIPIGLQPDFAPVSPTGIEARASGGPVRAGLPYLVGEEGPELVTFGRDAFVNPARSTRQILDELESAFADVPSLSRAPKQGIAQAPHFSFGDIIVHAQTNASPEDIAREIGKAINEQVSAAFSDGYC